MGVQALRSSISTLRWLIFPEDNHVEVELPRHFVIRTPSPHPESYSHTANDVEPSGNMDILEDERSQYNAVSVTGQHIPSLGLQMSISSSHYQLLSSIIDVAEMSGTHGVAARKLLNHLEDLPYIKLRTSLDYLLSAYTCRLASFFRQIFDNTKFLT